MACGRRIRPGFEGVRPGFVPGDVDRVAPGRGREIDHELGEGEGSFGKADEMNRLLRGHGQGQRMRVGEAHVLGGEAHEAAGDVERVLAALDHAGQPVQGGVGVGIANRLVQGADQIEMLFAALVVEKSLARQRLPGESQVDPARAPGERRGDFQGAQRASGVAVGDFGQEQESVVVDFDSEIPQPALPVMERAAHQVRQPPRREAASPRRPGSVKAERPPLRMKGFRW